MDYGKRQTDKLEVAIVVLTAILLTIWIVVVADTAFITGRLVAHLLN